MPQNRNPLSIEAQRRHSSGEKLVDIAQALGVPTGTVRRWKSTQDWDGQKKQSERSHSESSPKNANARFENDGLTRATNIKKNTDFLHDGEPEFKTNTTNRGGAPIGNKNAIGNRGGKGGPPKNKKALRTGEYETVIFSAYTLDSQEQLLAEMDTCEYEQQHTLLKILSIREYRIMKAIRQLWSLDSNATVVESETTEKTEITFTSCNRNKKGERWEGNTTTQIGTHDSRVTAPVMKRIMELEEALTRVQARKQKAIEVLHKMRIDEQNALLTFAKLRLYKQRLSGQYDLDALLADDDLIDMELIN